MTDSFPIELGRGLTNLAFGASAREAVARLGKPETGPLQSDPGVLRLTFASPEVFAYFRRRPDGRRRVLRELSTDSTNALLFGRPVVEEDADQIHATLAANGVTRGEIMPVYLGNGEEIWLYSHGLTLNVYRGGVTRVDWKDPAAVEAESAASAEATTRLRERGQSQRFVADLESRTNYLIEDRWGFTAITFDGARLARYSRKTCQNYDTNSIRMLLYARGWMNFPLAGHSWKWTKWSGAGVGATAKRATLLAGGGLVGRFLTWLLK